MQSDDFTAGNTCQPAVFDCFRTADVPHRWIDDHHLGRLPHGIGARAFHRLVDPEDKREFDPHQGARNLDQVASLLKSGRHEEAAQLCEALKKSGDASVLVLETMLARAGIRQEGFKNPSRWRRRTGFVRRENSPRRKRFCKRCWRKSVQRGCGADADAALRTGFAPQRQGRGSSPVARKTAAYPVRAP